MRPPLAVLSLLLLLSGSVAFAQTVLANQDVDTAKALAAFSQTPVQKVRLSGRVHAIAGSTNENGTFSFDLQSTGESKLDLKLASLTRTESTDAISDDPHCTVTKADGVAKETAVHNCWRSLDWLVPLLVLQKHASELHSAPTPSAEKSRDAASEFTVRRSNSHATGKTQALIEKLSAVTLKLDPATSLPASMDFNAHPEEDAGTDIPIVVRYSDYRQISGASIPFHIQKYLNNGLVLDLQVDDATIE